MHQPQHPGLSRYVFALLAIILLPQPQQAQQSPPAIQWRQSLGGSDKDQAYSIQQTSDGGYIIAGWSSSTDDDVTGNHGNSDYWIVKLAKSGQMEWQSSFGGSRGDVATSITQTSDGGYVVAGLSFSTDGDVTGNHGGSDSWIVRLTSAGVMEWQKSLGGSRDERANSIQQTSDGGYIVAGVSNSNDGDVTPRNGTSILNDYWIVKLTTAGSIAWQKSLGGSGRDEATSIQQTSDGGYIVAGWSRSNDGDVTSHNGASDSTDFWIVKLANVGAIQWQKSLGGSSHEYAYSIKQTADNGYIVAGWSSSENGDVTGNHGGNDSWIVKLTMTGEMEWQQSFGGSGGDGAASIQQTSDGGYVVAGGSESTDGDVTGNHGSGDVWVVKVASAGSIQWQKSLGGGRDENALSIQQTQDGGYIVAGWSSSNNGDVFVNHGILNNPDYWIVKLAPPTSDVQQEPAATMAALTILPNPAHTTAMLNIQSPAEAEYTIELISPLGEVVKRQSAQLGLGEQTVPLTNLESLPAGSYEVIVAGGGKQVAHSRLVLLGE